MTEPNRRQSPRATVMLGAAIGDRGPSQPIRVRNLSTTGALVEGEKLPAEGSTILFERNGRSQRAELVWLRGQRGGIRFDGPVCLRSSLRPVSAPRPTQTLRVRRPGLSSKPLTSGEIKVLERWAMLGLTAVGD